jgi:hypothetical protein
MSDQLKAGEQEVVGGGTIVYDVTLRKHGVYSTATGELHGYRGSLERARELALNIPSPPDFTPPPPAELSRSPRAMKLPGEAGVPVSVPKDARPSASPGGDGKFMATPQWIAGFRSCAAGDLEKPKQ